MPATAEPTRAGGTATSTGASTRGLSFAAFKEQQLVFRLTRQLAEAQFLQADRARSERLWQEVALLQIDPDRIITLLYGVSDLGDLEALQQLDRAYRAAAAQPHGFWPQRRQHPSPVTGRWRGAVHRGARSAAPPARRRAH
jgi:hypothetical protein